MLFLLLKQIENVITFGIGDNYFKMNTKKLSDIIGNSDIYLFDQILKERYNQKDKILDAGVGSGRNLYWFCNNNYDIWGLDENPESIHFVNQIYPERANNFIVCEISSTPFQDNYFDHIICCAVLHFAKSVSHFKEMVAELVRILTLGGSLFIRMASNVGIESYITPIENGIYKLGDESERFLLTNELLLEIMNIHQLTFLEPLKSTNVNNLRCMSTLVLEKKHL